MKRRYQREPSARAIPVDELWKIRRDLLYFNSQFILKA